MNPVWTHDETYPTHVPPVWTHDKAHSSLVHLLLGLLWAVNPATRADTSASSWASSDMWIFCAKSCTFRTLLMRVTWGRSITDHFDTMNSPSIQSRWNLLASRCPTTTLEKGTEQGELGTLHWPSPIQNSWSCILSCWVFCTHYWCPSITVGPLCGWFGCFCHIMDSHGLCKWYSQPMPRFLHNSYSSRH